MKKLLVSLVAAALLAACATTQTTNSGAVGVERKQIMMLSTQQVDKMAASGSCAIRWAKSRRKPCRVGTSLSTANANRPRRSSGAVVWFKPRVHTAMRGIIGVVCQLCLTLTV